MSFRTASITASFTPLARGKQPQPTVGLLYSDVEWKRFGLAMSVVQRLRERVPGLRVQCFGMDYPSTPSARLRVVFFPAAAGSVARPVFRLRRLALGKQQRGLQPARDGGHGVPHAGRGDADGLAGRSSRPGSQRRVRARGRRRGAGARDGADSQAAGRRLARRCRKRRSKPFAAIPGSTRPTCSRRRCSARAPRWAEQQSPGVSAVVGRQRRYGFEQQAPALAMNVLMRGAARPTQASA